MGDGVCGDVFLMRLNNDFMSPGCMVYEHVPEIVDFDSLSGEKMRPREWKALPEYGKYIEWGKNKLVFGYFRLQMRSEKPKWKREQGQAKSEEQEQRELNELRKARLEKWRQGQAKREEREEREQREQREQNELRKARLERWQESEGQEKGRERLELGLRRLREEREELDRKDRMLYERESSAALVLAGLAGLPHQ